MNGAETWQPSMHFTAKVSLLKISTGVLFVSLQWSTFWDPPIEKSRWAAPTAAEFSSGLYTYNVTPRYLQKWNWACSDLNMGDIPPTTTLWLINQFTI